MTHWTDELAFVSPNSRAIPRPKSTESPYYNVPSEERVEITRQLLAGHPLTGRDIAEVVLQAWDDIFESRIGVGMVGVDIFPDAQIMGYLLHELIPLRVAERFYGWRKDTSVREADLVYMPDPYFSIEIKTSSNPNRQVYGNRSYGVENSDPGKKAKSGFYVTVNYERWRDVPEGAKPAIRLIRFGWIDSTDWNAQTAETGQASSLHGDVYAQQLPVIYVFE